MYPIKALLNSVHIQTTRLDTDWRELAERTNVIRKGLTDLKSVQQALNAVNAAVIDPLQRHLTTDKVVKIYQTLLEHSLMFPNVTVDTDHIRLTWRNVVDQYVYIETATGVIKFIFKEQELHDAMTMVQQSQFVEQLKIKRDRANYLRIKVLFDGNVIDASTADSIRMFMHDVQTEAKSEVATPDKAFLFLDLSRRYAMAVVSYGQWTDKLCMRDITIYPWTTIQALFPDMVEMTIAKAQLELPAGFFIQEFIDDPRHLTGGLGLDIDGDFWKLILE